MGVVDPEDPDTLIHPEQHHASQLGPERLPVLTLEIERQDVLVLLRGVLGILHRPIRALAKPLGPLRHVGVVRRALERQVEGHLDALRLGLAEETTEVLEAPELRVNRLVAPSVRADGPRAAMISRGSDRIVVLALPVCEPDRVDGRQVDHVEAHLGDVPEAPLAVLERSVPTRLRRARSREHLVPGARSRPLPLDVHPQLPGVEHGVLSTRVAVHQPDELLLEGRLEPGRRLASGPGYERRGPGNQSLGVGASGSCRGLGHQLRAHQEIDPLVHPGPDLLEKVPSPGTETIDPGLHRVSIRLEGAHPEAGPPGIVAQGFHRQLGPGPLGQLPVAEQRGDLVVGVGVNVRPDLDLLAHHSLDGEAAGIDLGRHVLYHHPGRSGRWKLRAATGHARFSCGGA